MTSNLPKINLIYFCLTLSSILILTSNCANANDMIQLYGWGRNDKSQVTAAADAAIIIPRLIPSGYQLSPENPDASLTNLTSFALGAHHTLALTTTGQLLAWGSNKISDNFISYQGWLGLDNIDSATEPTPVLCGQGSTDANGFLTEITQVATGRYHSLALTEDSRLLVWGYVIDYAESGFSFYHTDLTPQFMLTETLQHRNNQKQLTNITNIYAGADFSLVRFFDQTIATWGENIYGNLGNGTTLAQAEPTLVLAGQGPATSAGYLTNVQQVAVGMDHVLALLDNGQVVAWGKNSAGELGNGEITNASLPVYVLQGDSPYGIAGRLSGVIAIAAGRQHSLALLSNGQVLAWGGNSGEIGDNTLTRRLQPVLVQTWSDNSLTPLFAQQIAAGGSTAGGGFSLAVTTDDQLASWGINQYGQLGQGNNEYLRVATISPETNQVKMIFASGLAEHVLALLDDNNDPDDPVYFSSSPQLIDHYGRAVLLSCQPVVSGDVSYNLSWHSDQNIIMTQASSQTTDAVITFAQPGEYSIYAAISTAQGMVASEPIILFIDAEVTEQTMQVLAFVARCYQQCLQRQPDSGGLNQWADILLNQSFTGENLIDNFFASAEFLALNLTNSDFVDRLYQTIFDRQPDSAGHNSWAAVLEQGLSRPEVIHGFTRSVEFSDLCARYKITPYKNDTDNGVSEFVAHFYSNVLGRPAASTEVDAWAEKLISHTINVAEMVNGFFDSAEYLQTRDPYLSNRDYVILCYDTFLLRSATETDISAWVDAIELRGASRQEVRRGFLYSAEFAEFCHQHNLQSPLNLIIKQ